MEHYLVRRHRFSREEIRGLLLSTLQTKGIEVRGEAKLILTDQGCTIEEFLPPADEVKAEINGKTGV